MKLKLTRAHRVSLSSVLMICVVLSANVAQAQFQWARRVASTVDTDTELSSGMVLDANANCYVTGWFDGTNDFGGVTLANSPGGGQDIFVAKYDSTGSLQWAQRAGGGSTNRDAGRGIGVDTNGNVYVTGAFYGPGDFGSFNLPASESEVFFLSKYDNAGAVQWVQQGIGGDDVEGTGLAVDAAGNSYALVFANNGDTVAFGSTNVSTPSDFDENYDASTILVKFDNTGTVQWAQVMGGYGETYATKVAADAAGNVYVRGTFSSTLTIGSTNLVVSPGASKNMFVAKFDNSGALIWVQQPSGGNVDEGGVAVDLGGNVYVSGAFDTNLNFGSGISLASLGSYDAFVARFNSSGQIQWARQAGGFTRKGAFNGFYWDVALDSQSNVYVGGFLKSGASAAKYSPAGALQWTVSATGPAASPIGSTATKCAVDSQGNCYLAGWYQGNVNFGAKVLQHQGYWNYFLAKIPDPSAPKGNPKLTIQIPRSGQSVSNSPLAAAGTVADGLSVTAVYYQLNGGPWTLATPGTSWSKWTASVLLNPGANTFRAYALDAGDNASSTNLVGFTYVPSAVLTVESEGGHGTFSPNYGGKLLAISNSYSITASPSAGFAFQYWSGGVPMTNAARLRFVMQSNLVIIANFKDSARPVDVITVPGVGQMVTNTPFTASGKARDNVGVLGAMYQLNGAGWNPVTTGNAFTNWTATNLLLNAGPNLIQAFAVDGAGNVSLTNSVKFNYKATAASDWAPDNLNGLLAQVSSTNGTESVGFDISRFAQAGPAADTNAEDYGVGGYAYMKTGTNTAQLTLSFQAPPNRTNGGPNTVGFVFTNHYQGTFTNQDGVAGTLSVSVATGLVPVTLAGRTIVATDSQDAKVTTVALAGNGTFRKTPANNGNGGASTGTYVFDRYSPVAGMLVLSYTDAADAGQASYVQISFGSASAGRFVVSSFDNTGTFTDAAKGTFNLQ